MATKVGKQDGADTSFMLREKGDEIDRKLAHGAAWKPAFFPERKSGWAKRKG